MILPIMDPYHLQSTMVECLKRTPEGITYPKTSVTKPPKEGQLQVEYDWQGRKSVFRQPSTIPRRFQKRIATHTKQITNCNPVRSSSVTLLRSNSVDQSRLWRSCPWHYTRRSSRLDSSSGGGEMLMDALPLRSAAKASICASQMGSGLEGSTSQSPQTERSVTPKYSMHSLPARDCKL